MSEEIPYSPPGMDEYIREGARKNQAWLRKQGLEPAIPQTESAQADSVQRVVGRCVEVGDDDEGQPSLVIHTTREQLKRIGRNLAYVDVVVTIAPPNAAGEPRLPGPRL